jgi:ribosomal protein S18 acetylase RimI-like enzyme
MNSEHAAMSVRAAADGDADALVDVWFTGWHDAHAALVPAALTRLRTRANFRDRLIAELAAVRVVCAGETPVGFAMVRGAELYQFYVAASARGSGAAAVLIADVEAHMAAQRIDVAWLACVVGNDRAARFYEKSGWLRTGTITVDADTASGPYRLEVWRFEKRLTLDPRSAGWTRHCC